MIHQEVQDREDVMGKGDEGDDEFSDDDDQEEEDEYRRRRQVERSKNFSHAILYTRGEKL